MKFLKIVFFILMLISAGSAYYFYQFANSPYDTSDLTKKVEFDLLRGMHPLETSEALEHAGLVKSGKALFWLGKFMGEWGGLKAADYELSPAMTPLQIIRTLKSGIGIQHSILVREGDNIYQVAESFQNVGLGSEATTLKNLKSREFIASVDLENEGLTTLEGYLFPNTYFYDKHDKADSVLRRMVIAFLRLWTPEYDARAKELGMTRKQIVTLASMIEKETGAAFERPIVSSVLHNRLRKKMRLQSDPTTIYGMWDHYEGKIHKSDLLRPTEFNTYTVPGLPAGPISNPNPDSVKAALYPADTDYLYFVSKNDGTHVFSKTYEEHSSYVRKLQVDPKAREGKSWRDLNKKK